MRFPLDCRQSEEATKEVDILADGKRRVEIATKPLGHIGDAGKELLPLATLGEIEAENRKTSRLQLFHAGYEAEQRRLAYAIGPDQRGGLPLGQGERNLVQGDDTAISMRKAFDPYRLFGEDLSGRDHLSILVRSGQGWRVSVRTNPSAVMPAFSLPSRPRARSGAICSFTR